MRAVVVDIEGTTSPTDAVHGQLFADARDQLAGWVAAHHDEPDVAAALDAARQEAGLPAGAPLDAVVAVLTRWIDEDVKATPLKTIEGRIWAEGFAVGRLDAHFFADVAPALRRWSDDGVHLAVFSSGATSVQRPWFGAAADGDLTSIVTEFFDTVNAGPKQDAASYERIAATVGARWSTTPDQLLFLSDVPGELDAAAAAGWQTVGVRRPGEPQASTDFGAHPTVTSFAGIAVLPAEAAAR